MKNGRTVLGVSLALTSAFLLWGAFAPRQLAGVSSSIQTWLLDAFGWFYLLCAAGFLITAILLIFSKYGDIPLGRDGEKPEFPLRYGCGPVHEIRPTVVP